MPRPPTPKQEVDSPAVVQAVTEVRGDGVDDITVGVVQTASCPSPFLKRQPGEDAGLGCGGDRTSSGTTTGRRRGGSAHRAALRVTRRSAF